LIPQVAGVRGPGFATAFAPLRREGIGLKPGTVGLKSKTVGLKSKTVGLKPDPQGCGSAFRPTQHREFGTDPVGMKPGTVGLKPDPQGSPIGARCAATGISGAPVNCQLSPAT